MDKGDKKPPGNNPLNPIQNKTSTPNTAGSSDDTTSRNNNNNNPASPDPSPSLSDRIQSSASGLLQSTFSNSSSHRDIPSSLSTSISGDKAGPSGGLATLAASSASSSQSVSGSLPSSTKHTSSGAEAGGSSSPSFESFRSTNASYTDLNRDRDREWREFENPADTSSFILTDNNLADTKGKGKERVDSSISETTQSDVPIPEGSLPTTSLKPDLPSTWHSNHPPATATTLSSDGHAVSALLSDPSFDPQTFSPLPSPSASAEPDLSFLSSSPQHSSQQFHSSPTSSSSSSSAPPQKAAPHPLDLIPDIPTLLTADIDSWTEIPGVAEWLEVDGEYMEGVWGYLKPYVQAAKDEVKGKETDHGVEDDAEGPAVKRLGLVLGHLRAKL